MPTTEETCPETEGPCSQCGKETFVYATDGTRLFSRHLDLHVYPADHEVVVKTKNHGYYWVKGHWVGTGMNTYWVKGHWSENPRSKYARSGGRILGA